MNDWQLFFGFGCGLVIGDFGKSVASLGGIIIACFGGILFSMNLKEEKKKK